MHSVFQTGFLGLWGNKVDAIDHHESEIEKLSKEVGTNFCFSFFCNVRLNICFGDCPIERLPPPPPPPKKKQKKKNFQ
jgi:hypothetical protein